MLIFFHLPTSIVARAQGFVASWEESWLSQVSQGRVIAESGNNQWRVNKEHIRLSSKKKESRVCSERVLGYTQSIRSQVRVKRESMKSQMLSRHIPRKVKIHSRAHKVHISPNSPAPWSLDQGRPGYRPHRRREAKTQSRERKRAINRKGERHLPGQLEENSHKSGSGWLADHPPETNKTHIKRRKKQEQSNKTTL